MNLMFWKKKKIAAAGTDSPPETDNDQTVAMEVPDLETPDKHGRLSRIKSVFSGLLRRFRKAPAPAPESAESDQPQGAHGSEGTQGDTATNLRPMRTKKRLIVGGAIGLLVLLLAGAGFAAWKIFLSHPEQENTEHPPQAAAAPSHDSPPEEHAEADQASEAPHSEIEDLRKKNEELQAQVEALKKEQKQDPAPDTGNGAASSAETKEMTISNKDPKAAAQSLREAIKAMNAGAGGTASKPAK
ncbi:MAG: hypothetical protein K8H84_06760 [Sulfuricella denitrificans]|nr:hypothetical protein [Sulfuricella denitrificans]